MQGLNLLGESPPAEEPPPPEEPLGLDLIRGWLRKPRPRLRRLWLWVPYLADGVRKAYGWLRENGSPALRKAAMRAWAWRGDVERLRARLEKAFPPGSRGRAVAERLATGSRLLLRAALLLVGIGREAERLRVWEPDRELGKRPPKPKRPPAGTVPEPAPETPGRAVPDEPAASSSADPTGGDESAVSSDPAKSPTDEVSQRDPSQPERSQPPPSQPKPSRPNPSPPGPSQLEPPRPEPAREDPPDQGSKESAPADPSPVPGLPPGKRADALAKLSKNLRSQILGLGRRPRKASLRFTIWRILNECGPADADRLGLLLGMDAANLAKRHLSPLVEHTVLERTIPDRINHPDQAYRSTGPPPGADGLPPISE